MMLPKIQRKWAAVLILGLGVLVGCGDRGATTAADGNNDEDGHGHGGAHASRGHTHTAPHGGVVNTIGDHHLELAFDAQNGEITLYVLGRDKNVSSPIGDKSLQVQLKVEDDEDFIPVNLLPVPQDTDPRGKTSRFAGSHHDLLGAKSFVAFVRISIEGKTYPTTYQIIPDKQVTAYVCPMNHEKGKVYFKPGKCPICKMALVEPKQAHADHDPKHGGDLLMAPNHWNHLEGVLSSEREFRVYMYNNFTKPISARPFVKGARADFVSTDDEGNDVGKRITRPLTISVDGSYLAAALPGEMKLPICVTAWIKFYEGQDRPDVFTFPFKKVSDLH